MMRYCDAGGLRALVLIVPLAILGGFGEICNFLPPDWILKLAQDHTQTYSTYLIMYLDLVVLCILT